MIERFFGPEAKARVEAAVRDEESRSQGQIVPLVVAKSAGYPEARYRGALLGIGLSSAAALALRLPLAPAELLLAQVAGGVLGGLAALWDPVERVLAGRAELELAARDRALRAFREQGLHRTQRGTGVLVFASLFERRAVILGDHGIDEKMGGAGWQRAVDLLAAGMRRGDPAGGFCEAIAAVGAKLAEHFPRGPAAPGNELPDALRTEPE